MENYPYRNDIYTDDDRIKIFKNLINHNLTHKINNNNFFYKNIRVLKTLFLYNGQFHYLLADNKAYDNVYILSDTFNDICRSKCGFGNNISPLEYFQNNHNKLVNHIKNKKLEVNKLNMREAIYENTIECSIHNPAVIKFFINKYHAKKVLDPCSGWGDRLLGAMASGIQEYTGIDPNECLHPNYQKMIQLLKQYMPMNNDAAKIDMIEDKMENVNFKKLHYDLVYTSPPYFDYEKYSNNVKQSHISHNRENDWYQDFLQVLIMKSIDALKFGGRMVLYISQEAGKTYMEKMLKWVPTLKNVYYIGSFIYASSSYKQPHPIFIYKKSHRIPRVLYNPKPMVTQIDVNGRKIHVVRDDYIIGGTKTRAAIPIIQKILSDGKINKLIYSGAANGYAQVAIAYTLMLLKRPDINLIFVFQKVHDIEIFKLQELTKFYHSNTTYIIREGPMKILYPIVDAYNKPNEYIIPFGFSFPDYKEVLYENLLMHISVLSNIKRMWLVVGSGTVLSVLQRVLPNTLFFGVQVGREVKDDEVYDKSRLTLYVSSYKFYDKYKGKQYYNSLMNYDAKVMEFVEKYGESGDYVWNVAGAHKHLL